MKAKNMKGNNRPLTYEEMRLFHGGAEGGGGPGGAW